MCQAIYGTWMLPKDEDSSHLKKADGSNLHPRNQLVFNDHVHHCSFYFPEYYRYRQCIWLSILLLEYPLFFFNPFIYILAFGCFKKNYAINSFMLKNLEHHNLFTIELIYLCKLHHCPEQDHMIIETAHCITCNSLI